MISEKLFGPQAFQIQVWWKETFKIFLTLHGFPDVSYYEF